VTEIVVYFDYQSPFAFILSRLLADRLSPHGARADWRPIELTALSSYTNGMPYSPGKRVYVVKDAIRQAAFHDVPIQTPQPFPVDSGLALRIAAVARRRGALERVHDRLFAAAWAEQRDVADEPVLADIIAAAGGEPEAWLDEARQAAAGEDVEGWTAEAEDLGVFGVPTLVHEGELFWGVDSLPLLEWTLARAD